MRRLTGLLVAALLLSACAGGGTQTRDMQREAAEINLQLGIGYLRQNNLVAAQERLERAMQQDPGLAMAPAALGLVFERLEDPDGAERLYRRAASLGPRDPDILNALAVFLCSTRQQPEEALRYFDRAIAVPLSVKVSNKAMLNANAGTCARRIDPGRAETYFRTALNHDPQWVDALFQLADLAWSSGEPLRARAFIERYLASGQSSAAVLLLGWQVERALGDADAALGYARRLRSEFPRSQEAGLLPADLR
ncbi:MAG: type IV pilus biogenesis/stability protein PilW [Chromatiales bacterium]|nr:type IV pilus biogenesis/stability protein PilW [Chromatiales bacterium]